MEATDGEKVALARSMLGALSTSPQVTAWEVTAFCDLVNDILDLVEKQANELKEYHKPPLQRLHERVDAKRAVSRENLL